ncbi:MAG: hypothetical protein HYV27_05395 [Candidatus Hydrogenedentes bacterium]|nr:hypothetical protein [Candidatus Hydrogenedentota bacterium]
MVLNLNMALADYDAGNPLVRLVTAPPNRRDITVCLKKQPKLRDGQIQKAYIPITGETCRCNPYDRGDSLDFYDVFTWEPSNNHWHGYLEARFLDARGEPALYVVLGRYGRVCYDHPIIGEGCPVLSPPRASFQPDLSEQFNND